MPGFYHFLPLAEDEMQTSGNYDPKQLARFGLATVLRDVVAWPDDAVMSPAFNFAPADGLSGVILYPKTMDGPEPPSWSYREDQQSWTRVEQPGCEARWLGWNKDEPPTPKGLIRKRPFKDYELEDNRSQKWYVPAARSSDPRRASLPTVFTFDQAGEVIRQVDDEFVWLWELSGQVLDCLAGRTEQDEAWRARAAISILAVNYRIGTAEVTELVNAGVKLLTTETIKGILGAVIDQDLTQEYEDSVSKKKAAGGSSPALAPASSSASPGAEIASPTTDPAAAP